MDWKDKEMLKCYKKSLKHELINDLSDDFDACVHNYEKHKQVASMINTICDLNKMLDSDDYGHDESHAITDDMLDAWAMGMENSDGTTGAHWTLEQTTAVANQINFPFGNNVSPKDFWVALNMIYSDYGATLKAAGVTDAAVYGNLAKDFLLDKDAIAPKEKLCYYYKYIVKK